MGDMQPRKGQAHKFLGTGLLLAACGFLFLSGCRNMLQPPEVEAEAESNESPGTLLLTINRQGAGRTIRPESSLDHFVRFDLELIAISGGNTDFVVKDWTMGDSIELGAGAWYLRVTAFLPGEDGNGQPLVLEAARGSHEEYINVAPGQIVVGNVELSPIAEGQGTFSWDIGFFPGAAESIATARMEIRRNEWDNAPLFGPFYFIGGWPMTPNPGYLSMTAGRYFVVLALYNDRGERAGVSAVLHVYHNMESHLDKTFTPGDFPVSLLDFVLSTWDGSSWNFAAAGITAGHFSFLGIDGVTAGNFGEVVPWLDRLTYYFGSPLGLPGLQTLVDAAIVGVEENAILVLGDSLADRLAWLRSNAADDTSYIIALSGNESISPAYSGLPAGRSGVTVTLMGDLEGDGNMRTISLSESGRLIVVGEGVTFVLGDNVTLGGRLGNDGWYWHSNNGPLVLVNDGGYMVMNHGAMIAGNLVGDGIGGGVWNYGTFTMHGGEISNNNGWGGGVRNVGTFFMYDGAISRNASSSSSSSVLNYGTFIMHDGEISGNTQSAGGGGGVLNNGVFTMYGGAISGNNIDIGGVRNYGTFVMYDGEISGNNTYSDGGGMFVGDGGIFRMYSGKISDNLTYFMGWSGNSGGVHVANGGTFHMYGGKIYGNNSYDRGWDWASDGIGSGGGVHVASGGTFRISNGIIFGIDAEEGLRNIADIGAALFNSGTAQFGTFSNGTFSRNGDLTTTDYTIEVVNGLLRVVVTFNANGGTGTVPEPSRGFAGDEIAIPTPSLERDGYFFVGWNTSADATGTAYFESGSPLLVGNVNITLYAIWSEFEFDLASGTITDFSGTDTELIIPPTINTVAVTAIGDSAFWERQLISVVIPDGVTSIGNNAFRENQLISVDIPDSVTTIREGAFGGNTLTSITIPGNVDISPPPSYDLSLHTMGTHGESFLAFYNSTGRRAGTYTWDGTRWIFDGEGGFTISFTGFTDAAGGVEAEYTTVSILAAPANITVVGSSFDGIRWIHNGELVPDADGPTLDFSTLHGNRIGIHHVTVEVNIGGRWYSRHIRINVTR